MNKLLEKIAVALIVVMFAIIVIYYGTYAAKHFSYTWWYEDLVKQTILQMVNENALRSAK